jgi:nitroreductase
MITIENLKWRSAIKKFDPVKTVSDEDLEILIEAANLAPTSFGIQPFRLVVVKNKEVQKELLEISFGQQQVLDASAVLVFAIETSIGQEQIDNYFDRIAEVRSVELESLAGYKEMMLGFVTNMNEANKSGWASKQAYIALGTLITAAAELKIDACPMEGFDPIQYQNKLGLKDKGLMPVVILPIGYRSDKDHSSKAEKVRKKRSDFVVEID